MWSTSSIPPTTTTAITKHLPLIVSAKPSYIQTKKSYNYLCLAESSKSNTSSVNSPATNKPKQLNTEEEEEEEEEEENETDTSRKSQEEEKTIGGSDILWALLKASASSQKTKVKKKKKEVVASSKIKVGGEDQTRKEERDYRNVKPLLITNDWIKRLDDLERRIQELLHS